MDTSQLPYAKGVTAKARIAKVRSARQSVDRRESAKVKARSGGICELQSVDQCGVVPCLDLAVHVHHLMGGHGVRGRSESARSERKLHVCARHHREIHGGTLQRIPQWPLPLWTDRYRRVR